MHLFEDNDNIEIIKFLDYQRSFINIFTRRNKNMIISHL